MAHQIDPCFINILGQGFGGRHALAQGCQISRRCIFVAGDGGEQGGQPEQHRGFVGFYCRQDCLGAGLSGHQEDGGTNRKREGRGIAETVGEIHFGHGIADIVRAQFQDLRAKRRLRIGHVVMQMHDALGHSGRTG